MDVPRGRTFLHRANLVEPSAGTTAAALSFGLASKTDAMTLPLDELLDRLDACIGRLDQQLDVGYERIAARCPELAPALAQSPWAPWLPGPRRRCRS